MKPNCSAHVPAITLLLAAMAAPAFAQCATQWLPGDGRPGTDGPVGAAMWDPDGAGPAAPVLVVAGGFSAVGDLRAYGAALYDPVLGTWSLLGSGPGASIGVLAPQPNGDLYGAGTETVSGFTTYFVARWTGTSWARLGTSTNSYISALAVLPNGDVVAGGAFTIAGNVFANGLARWNGSVWTPLGAGVTGTATGAGASVNSLTVLPNGDLVAAGRFTTAGVVSANNIARWDGTAWFPLGTGLQPAAGPFSYAWGQAVACLPNGDVLAGGTFATGGGVVARWDGTAWSALGTGWYTKVNAIRVLPNGDVLAGGDNGAYGYNIARWNGVSWASLGAGTTGYPFAVISLSELPNGDVVAAGSFSTIGGVLATNIARWDGTAWSAMAVDHSIPDNGISAASILPNGNLVAGGSFRFAGAAVANGIAQRVGGNWGPMGTGILPNSVAAVAVLPNGDIIAGGTFTSAGGVAANNIARWDGVAWSPLGVGVTGGVARLFVRRNGDLIASNYAGIWRWDGLAWTQISAAVAVAVVTELANGDLVAAGHLLVGGGVAVARWTGTTWVPWVPGYWSAVNDLVELPNGDLLLSGRWVYGGTIVNSLVARWNGGNWWIEGLPTLPNSSSLAPVNALSVLPDGSVLAAGNFSAISGVPAANIARWDGQHWSAVGAGLTSNINGSTASASAMLRAPNGDVVVVGSFTSAGTQVSLQTARLTTTCPATAVSFGSGCVGAGGANVLASKSLPWVGSTYTAEATGLAPVGLAVGVRSLSATSIPLSAILPQGLPGCTLLAAPGGTDIYVPTGGRVVMSFPIPNLAVLAGQVVYQQVVSLELDAALNITALTSTNALTATIGVF